MIAIISAILVCGGVALCWSIRKTRRRQAAENQLLLQNGFQPCEGEKARLEAVVRSLRRSSDWEVRRAWKRTGMDGPVYWYEASADGGRDHSRLAADEFLCTLRRPSKQPFVLYLKPQPFKNGFASRMLEKLIAVTNEAGLEALARPENGPATALLAAFGPKGARLSDLLDEATLDRLARGAAHGVFAIRGQDEHCALELLGHQYRKALGCTDWLDTWRFVQQVATGATSVQHVSA